VSGNDAQAGARVGLRPGPAGRGPVGPRPVHRDRLRLLEELRLVALHVETAAVLERRAGLSGNRVLAAMLAERATRHRQAAARVRCGLGRAGGTVGGARPPERERM
jgi:hypothetical protein